MKMSNNVPTKGSIGARIKHYRVQAGMSQQELADALKPTYNSGTAISLVESDARGVDAADLVAFAKALGISVAVLIDEENAVPDFSTALRSDGSLTPKDKKEVLNFYNYVKSRKG